MKNYEKYADEIREYNGSGFCKNFIKPYILKTDSCGDMDCYKCRMLQMIWLMEEYEEPEEPEEPEVDWSKVEVDTPILVRTVEWAEWARRYFAKYEDEMVYVWNLGRTSWSATYDKDVSAWKYAKLAESEEE